MKRRGGHLALPDRMCMICYGRMPPAETEQACKGCIDERREEEKLLNEIRGAYPHTKALDRLDIYRRLFNAVRRSDGNAKDEQTRG